MDRLNVLIVEDESLVALEMKFMLESMDYAVVGIADTGERAIAEAGQGRPDIVLMDINLNNSGMDGIEAATRIRERFGIGYIFVTGYTDEPTYVRAMKTEPLGYLNKPLSEDVLHVAIQDALRKTANTKIH